MRHLISTVLIVALGTLSANANENEIAWQLRPGSTSAASLDSGGIFDAAGIMWTAADDLSVRVRVSSDGRTWSDWHALPLDGDLTDTSSARYLTAITRFDGPKRFIELSFSGPAEGVTVTLFKPAPANRPRRQTTAESKFGPIPIRSRVDWGCPDGADSGWKPAYTRITHAVVHHTAGSNTATDYDAEVRNIWYYHTVTNGWGDIGYNFLIAPDGVIYEGRSGGHGAIGAHFSCRNTNTVGVSLLGTFTNVPPTDAALASLERILGELATRNGLDPLAIVRHAPSGLELPQIIGHRDGNVPGATCTITECPGNVVYSMLPAMRSEVACRPVIERHPQAAWVKPGDMATFSVGARGGEPLTYQWYSGETAVEGATNATLEIAPAQSTSYWVRVINACSTADSLEAQVTVSAPTPRRRAARP
jgi:hypothetical protein